MLMMVAPSVAYLRPVAMRICIPRAQSFLVNGGPDASCSAAPGSWLLWFLRGSTLLVSISLTKRILNADCTSCQFTASKRCSERDQACNGSWAMESSLRFLYSLRSFAEKERAGWGRTSGKRRRSSGLSRRAQVVSLGGTLAWVEFSHARHNWASKMPLNEVNFLLNGCISSDLFNR